MYYLIGAYIQAPAGHNYGGHFEGRSSTHTASRRSNSHFNKKILNEILNIWN